MYSIIPMHMFLRTVFSLDDIILYFTYPNLHVRKKGYILMTVGHEGRNRSKRFSFGEIPLCTSVENS